MLSPASSWESLSVGEEFVFSLLASLLASLLKDRSDVAVFDRKLVVVLVAVLCRLVREGLWELLCWLLAVWFVVAP